MTDRNKILLASASPRRRQLLEQIGVEFDVLPVDLDETPLAGEAPQHFVERLALEKAREGFRRQANGRPVLGSDTTVVVNGCMLGKPVDKNHGLEMLAQLSGSEHQVLTAVAMVDAEKSRCLTSTSHVYFRSMSSDEILAYWETGEPADKAGGYGIQGIGAQFIERLDGSYSGVMGLPLFETAQLLQDFGIVILHGHE